MLVKCTDCGVEFKRAANNKRCAACLTKFKNAAVLKRTKLCTYCKTSFIASSSSPYCSVACRNKTALERKEKRNCKLCNTSFVSLNNLIYCSPKCRHEAVKERQRKKNLTSIQQMIATRLAKETASINVANEISSEARKVLIELALKQQISTATHMQEYLAFKASRKCIACNATSKEAKLKEHHVSYFPEEKVVLCSKCSHYLHFKLLGRKRVRLREFT